MLCHNLCVPYHLYRRYWLFLRWLWCEYALLFGFVLRLVLYDQNYIDFILIELDVSIWQTGYSSVAQHGIVSDLSLSVAEVSLI